MFGSDGSPIVQYVVIFAVIFAALAAIVFTVRRLTGRNLALPGRAGTRGRQPRLGIVDVYELDRARQLILLRRDNVEHLLLVGGPNDVVVERNIQRTQRPLSEAALRSEPASDALDEPLPDPMVQGGRLPEPARALPEMAARRSEPLFDPGFAMPVVVPPPVPRSAAGPAVTLPLDAALLGGDEPGQDISAPLSASPPLSPPPAEAPVQPVREPVNPRRILSRTAPPLAEPRPGPASERRTDVVGEAESTQAPSLTVSSERRSVDPAILSDMARQLQAALARPSSAVTPAPAPTPPMPAAAPGGVDPVAATMALPASLPPAAELPASIAAAPLAPAPLPPPASMPPALAPQAPVPNAQPPSPSPAVDRSAPPVRPSEFLAGLSSALFDADPAPVPPPPQPAMPKAVPAFRETPPKPTPPPVPPAAPPAAAPSQRPDPKAPGNPFSVEEIEAEFARLLGRPLDKQS